MPEWILTLITSFVTSGVLGALFAAISKRIVDGSPTKVAVRLLLQDRLEQFCRECISRECITASQLKYIYEAHKAYEGVGGNGYFKKLVDIVEELPIKEE